jgi:Asp-tRNA(Asn)/Glu-tRNA(Gln) amidotransferase A subunit family amidase
LEHTPGGSSSGSAAAVGAGLAPLALGTQTIGSVIRPAAFCGVVGFKPTYNRISKEGVIPLSPSFDHVGVFASDVAGVRLAASLLCRDWRPPASAGKPILGIPAGPYLQRASAEMLEHFDATCKTLAEAGYEIKSVNVMPDFADIRERHYLITAAEAAHGHADWFPRFRELYHPKTVELLERGRSIADTTLAEVLSQNEMLWNELTHVMDAQGVSAWIAPATPGPAPAGLDSTGDPVMNLPWSQVGFPAITIPSGRAANGLPLGLQVVGPWHEDELLLGWAIGIEGIIGHAIAELRLV